MNWLTLAQLETSYSPLRRRNFKRENAFTRLTSVGGNLLGHFSFCPFCFPFFIFLMNKTFRHLSLWFIFVLVSVHWCFVCMCICWGCRISWYYRQLLVATWVLRIKPMSFRREASNRNHCWDRWFICEFLAHCEHDQSLTGVSECFKKTVQVRHEKPVSSTPHDFWINFYLQVNVWDPALTSLNKRHLILLLRLL